ncbi:alpha/beta fold hydrolase [Roseomonas sp. OT10]|uniref:alpha/beta hydrolase n=1 Tax=Roseomonas cutis TaxID=2897332 RepID=UPI001E37436E|nr:alpha/beta fold hydrolase [Roseomonas sp. OT10]UFN48757.1 alpha/beta fold hydrolase [Roseomonas sp. OT10]
MRRRNLLAAPFLATPLLAAPFLARPAGAQPAGVAMEEMLVPGGDPGVQLYLRNKRPESGAPASPARTVLCVHGATYPASTTFDLPLAGVSWMDYMAGRGFDVWSVDLRGYGRSTRDDAMSRPPEGAAPLTTAAQAVSDVAAAVRHIREKRGLPRLSLIGWSWGTTLVGRFATENPGQVERAVLYAPVWTGGTAALGEVSGAFRSVTRAQARERWMNGVPQDRRANLIPPGWFEHWADATFATDPDGARQVPSVLRAPNGVLVDLRDWSQGKAGYDPAKLTMPTLLVVAEWDRDTPPIRAFELFPLLTASPGKRLVVLGEGTHTMMLERNRGALFQAVQVFLEESPA